MSSLFESNKQLTQRDFEKVTLFFLGRVDCEHMFGEFINSFPNVMGFYGRIASNRKAFVVPKNNESNLYQTCVDRFIMKINRRDIIAFIEVKQSLKSTNDNMLRQIGAQMAAFIRIHHDKINNFRYVERLTSR